MTKPPLIRARRRTGICLLTLALGCSAGEALIPFRPDPLLYVVLNQRTQLGAAANNQRAFLLTVGSPTASEYRVAEEFTMRRTRDGALFVWQDLGNRGVARVDENGASLDHGNYALPDSALGSSFGARDIAPGDTYDLTVRTGGLTIRGAVTVPASFSITVSQGTPQVVSWPRVAGAGRYSVDVRGHLAPTFQTDTAFVLPPLPPGGAEVRISALDENLASYVVGDPRARVGIDQGYGVFGALTTATLYVRPMAAQLSAYNSLRQRVGTDIADIR